MESQIEELTQLKEEDYKARRDEIFLLIEDILDEILIDELKNKNYTTE